MTLTQIIYEAAEGIVGQETVLNQLDAVMGDGEHGSNMKKCFRAVQESLPGWEGKSQKQILDQTGVKLLTSGGGTATTLLGFFLKKTAGALPESGMYDGAVLASALEQALTAALEKSKAKAGDKTMMDALIPCVRMFSDEIRGGKEVPEAVKNAAQAAREGAEATAAMVAKRGRGLYVGERGVGTRDPGAVSVSLLAETVSRCVNKKSEELSGDC